MKAGTVIDAKYRIDATIGKGGMGAVYRAWHLGTERNVALKVLLPTLQQSREAIERFQREARASGRLNNPHIVNIFDFGVAIVEGKTIYYLAMEFLHGTTLREFTKRSGGRLSASQAIEIMSQIGDAVDAAHAVKIVHRDLKPDNIWVQTESDGSLLIKVIDFGIAKLLDEGVRASLASGSEPGDFDIEWSDAGWEGDDEEPRAETNSPTSGPEVRSDRPKTSELSIAAGRMKWAGDSEPAVTPVSSSGRSQALTVAGGIVGTPAYMAPEQFDGRADAAVDVYACGVIAYQMLAGALPRRGSLTELMLAHRENRPVALIPGVTPALNAVVARSLSAQPDRRPASTSAFALALRRAAEDEATLRERASDVPVGETLQLAGTLVLPYALPALAFSLAAQSFVVGPLGILLLVAALLLLTPLAVATTAAFSATSSAVSSGRRVRTAQLRLLSTLSRLLPRLPLLVLKPLAAAALLEEVPIARSKRLTAPMQQVERRLIVRLTFAVLVAALLVPFCILARSIALDISMLDVRRGVMPGFASSVAASVIALMTALAPVVVMVGLQLQTLLTAVEAFACAREIDGERVPRRIHPRQPPRFRPLNMIAPTVVLAAAWAVTGLVGFSTALVNNAAKTLEVFLAFGASPEPNQQRQPLHTSALRGREEALAALLAAGANPNVFDELAGPGTGAPPLIAAIEGRCSACVRILLEAGADPNLRTSTGDSPLDRALRVESPQRTTLVKILLAKGADPARAAGGGTSAREKAAKLDDPQVRVLLGAPGGAPQ